MVGGRAEGGAGAGGLATRSRGCCSSAVTRGAAASMAETLRRLRGGMVICRFGGLVVPDEGDLRPLASVLECPLFLVR